MALDLANRLVRLGMPTELAKELASAIDGVGDTYTDADARTAIATKTEIAALNSGSTVANVVAALKA